VIDALAFRRVCSSDEKLSQKARTANDSLIQSTCTCSAYLSLEPLAIAWNAGNPLDDNNETIRVLDECRISQHWYLSIQRIHVHFVHIRNLFNFSVCSYNCMKMNWTFCLRITTRCFGGKS